jgi:hypothetical protein
LEGGPLNWRDPSLDGFCLLIRGGAETPLSNEGTVLIVVNGGTHDKRVMLPDPGAEMLWRRVLDTAAPQDREARVAGNRRQAVQAHSLGVFIGERVSQ